MRSLLCQETSNRRVKEWFVWTHHERKPEPLHQKSLYSLPGVSAALCIMYNLSEDGEEEEESHSRGAVGSGPLRSGRPDKRWVVWALRYHSGDFKRARDSVPCQALAAVLLDESTRTMFDRGNNARRFIPTLRLDTLNCVFIALFMLILFVVTNTTNWNSIQNSNREKTLIFQNFLIGNTYSNTDSDSTTNIFSL